MRSLVSKSEAQTDEDGYKSISLLALWSRLYVLHVLVEPVEKAFEQVPLIDRLANAVVRARRCRHQLSKVSSFQRLLGLRGSGNIHPEVGT